jgi:hypothetical protein
MTELSEFYTSSNGDTWLLGDDGEIDGNFVIHRANTASGGHETRSSVPTFLGFKPVGPEHEALAKFSRWAQEASEFPEQSALSRHLQALRTLRQETLT